MKPRVRVKAPLRRLGSGVPDGAQPGDLVVGNRGAAAEVMFLPNDRLGGILVVEHVGNIYDGLRKPLMFYRRVYDQRGLDSYAFPLK